MLDLVTSHITIYGNAEALAPEVDRIHNALTPDNQAPRRMLRDDLLATIYRRPEAVPLSTVDERWPLWIEPEFRAPDFLTFISPGCAVYGIQDHLTRHLSNLDPRVITLMEWHCWPEECGARMAYLHKQIPFSIKKESSRDENILRDVYCTRSGEADVDENEADVAYLWDEVEHCSEYVKAMARRACSRIRKSSFSRTVLKD